MADIIIPSAVVVTPAVGIPAAGVLCAPTIQTGADGITRYRDQAGVVLAISPTNCAAVIACILAAPVGAAAVPGTTSVLGLDGQWHLLPAGGAMDPYATPAQTQAGVSTTTIVNPADLFARENIAAQVGVSNNVAAIPAPTAGQSNWATNLLGETLHYAPGLGWKIVDNRYGAQIVQPAGVIPTPVSAWATAVSLVAPRAGRIIATAHINVDNFIHSNWAGGLAINGVNKSANNAVDVGTGGSVSAQGGGVSPYNTSSGNAVVTWTGDVTAGTVISAQGITVGSTGQIRLSNLEYTYIN